MSMAYERIVMLELKSKRNMTGRSLGCALADRGVSYSRQFKGKT
jgi:hypothetical protein